MTATQKPDLIARAHEGWGDTPPDWIIELAKAAMETNQRVTGDKIGYSSSVVSQAISRTYAGDIDRVEEKVRGALMKQKVSCPILVEVARDTCLNWQKKPIAGTSSLRMKMYRACRSGCPNSRLS